MNDLVSRYGEWAFVAGSAEGIGASFSKVLAEKGFNLILSDINGQALEILSRELEQKFGIASLCLQHDLSLEFSWTQCLDVVKSKQARLFIYVPAVSMVKRFVVFSDEDLRHFLSLNVHAPLFLVHRFLKQISNGKPYGIILMSSLAGLLGPAFVAPYAASKAYLVGLSESLFYELKDNNVDILACCAGPTSTPTYWESRPVNQSKAVTVSNPDDVARCALKNLGKKPVCIPGRKNRLLYFFLIHLFPSKLAGLLVSRSMKRMYGSV